MRTVEVFQVQVMDDREPGASVTQQVFDAMATLEMRATIEDLVSRMLRSRMETQGMMARVTQGIEALGGPSAPKLPEGRGALGDQRWFRFLMDPCPMCSIKAGQHTLTCPVCAVRVQGVKAVFKDDAGS